MTLAAPGEPEGTPLDDGPHGGAAGPGPAELLLVASAGCAAWDVVEILRKQRQDVTAIECHVDGEQQADAPWTFRHVVLVFAVHGRALDHPPNLNKTPPTATSHLSLSNLALLDRP